MRWDRLFSDLEGQARALEEAERDAEIADRVRVEVGQTTLLDRLRAQEGADVTVAVDGAGNLSGTLAQVGADWLLLRTPYEVVVPMAAVVAVRDLPPASVSSDAGSMVSRRLRLTTVLRAIAMNRCAVAVTLRNGSRLTGTPDRVALDCVDLALHDLDEVPRRSSVRGRVTVAFAALAVVQRC
jgi:hypothetical protein